jgi:hypothetical protein
LVISTKCQLLGGRGNTWICGVFEGIAEGIKVVDKLAVDEMSFDKMPFHFCVSFFFFFDLI